MFNTIEQLHLLGLKLQSYICKRSRYRSIQIIDTDDGTNVRDEPLNLTKRSIEEVNHLPKVNSDNEIIQPNITISSRSCDKSNYSNDSIMYSQDEIIPPTDERNNRFSANIDMFNVGNYSNNIFHSTQKSLPTFDREKILNDLQELLSQQAIKATSETMIQFVQELSPNVTPKNNGQYLLSDREDARKFQLKYGMDGKNDNFIKKKIIEKIMDGKEVRW